MRHWARERTLTFLSQGQEDMFPSVKIDTTTDNFCRPNHLRSEYDFIQQQTPKMAVNKI